MYDYDLENRMWDRQRDMLRDADRDRLVALAQSRPDGEGGAASRPGFLAAIAGGFRSLLAPGRTARIQGDA
jgi:hypothetical protein